MPGLGRQLRVYTLQANKKLLAGVLGYALELVSTRKDCSRERRVVACGIKVALLMESKLDNAGR